MDSRYQIVRARARDVRLLPAIELAAAQLLQGHAPDSVLNTTTSEDEFRQAQSEGRLWVSLSEYIPVGFALVERFATGDVHLKELDVHPDHGRRGLGARLVEAVCNWATRVGAWEVTLTTFRDVPWNLPFYAQLGFEEIPVNQLSGSLVSILADEARSGLDPVRRVAMRRRAYASALVG